MHEVSFASLFFRGPLTSRLRNTTYRSTRQVSRSGNGTDAEGTNLMSALKSPSGGPCPPAHTVSPENTTSDDAIYSRDGAAVKRRARNLSRTRPPVTAADVKLWPAYTAVNVGAIDFDTVGKRGAVLTWALTEGGDS